MKNIKFFVLTILASLSSSVLAQKTYTFDDGVALETDWTVVKDVPDGGKGTCEISDPGKFSAKDGKYLYFTFENKSKITISVTSKESFSNISNITFDAVASDNSKPNWTLNIVDDNGNVVKNIYSEVGAKDKFNTGGTNKWGVSNTDVSPATSGHIQLVLYASSSGKFAAIDNLAVTYQAGPALPSSDATLKSLKYNEKEIVLQAGKLDYDVELPYGTTNIPIVTAEANDSKATAIATQASSLPGTAKVNVTAEDGETKLEYKVNFTVATTVKSDDATLKSLTYGGTLVPGFAADKYSYDIELESGIKTPPMIAAVANDEKATVAVTQASGVPGSGFALVTAEDGSQLKYTVNYISNTPTPSTGLTLHEPGVYEEKEEAGGYGTDLVVSGGREYEVYYAFKGKISGSSVAAASTTPGGTYLTDANTKALDGWFEANPGSMEESGADATDEFAAGGGNWKMKNNETLTLHVKGYDEFTILAADNNASDANKQFHVFVNGAEVTPGEHSTTPTVRRVALSATQEYVIEVKAYGGSQMKFYAWSLRVAEVPKVKWIKGDLENQDVLQTTEMKPVTFFTKYNSKGETKIEWDGEPATGITLTKKASTSIGDTLVLGGTALCPTGEYKFRVATFFNGEEQNSIPCKLTVSSKIVAKTDVNVTVRQGKQMQEINFTYYALTPNDVVLQWINQTPEGISSSGKDGEYTISGKPTTKGEFPYTVSVKGGNTIEGKITVEDANLGDHPVLYLCRNRDNKTNDGVYEYLKSKGVNFDVQPTLKSARNLEEYAPYDWILISEDVNADNEEVLYVARGLANKPVLNMKSFSYTADRLNWGNPNNGSLSEEGRFITVQRDDHPIFKALNKKKGDKIQVLESINQKGLMPVDANMPLNSLCLATALTRSTEDYYGDGEPQTFLHEVPSIMRGGNKYICLPVALSSSKNLSTDGKKLLNAIVDYLQDATPSTVSAPTLQINSFRIGTVAGTIDQGKNTIYLEIDKAEHPELGELDAIVPTITVYDEVYSFVIDADKEIDFRTSTIVPIPFVVTDYINRRVYEVTVRIFTSEGLEEVYAVGDWVNIFDIYGRKIATTNENIFTMSLPHGVYLIVNEQGKTAKIMK